LGKDPRTKPVVVLQLSWSAGDHLVSRPGLKTLNDLRRKDKKVRIACQQGGPHVGLLYDSLDAAKIGRDEIEIVWVKDLTGESGPAEAFRKDTSIDACCVITPDMIGLTGGYDATGSGAEGTVEGAHVLNSTRDMSRSIADVYAVRSDWYKTNQALVQKFVAGYLKATQDLVNLRREFEQSQRMTDDYRRVLTLAQQIFGEEVLPTLEVDGHGLLLDCAFVGLPGQVAFFEDRGNLSGFEPKMAASLDLATSWGYAKFRSGFDPPTLNYQEVATLAGLKYEAPKSQGGIEIGADAAFPSDDVLDDRTIVSFTINFQPNQPDFSADRYGAEFNRAIQAASTFGNAIIVIRGHADPTKALIDMIKGGMEKGTIRRTGQAGEFRYFIRGSELDLTNTATVVKLIESGAFETAQHKPRDTVRAALNLSLSRAEAVKQSLVDFAKQQNVNLVADQLQPTGAGISEPLIPKPKDFDEALQNMRVEFRIVRVPAETLQEADFSF
jgi:ABC-type nitrate/sulfonate/bicarbonate transport system substrate-binding protein